MRFNKRLKWYTTLANTESILDMEDTPEAVAAVLIITKKICSAKGYEAIYGILMLLLKVQWFENYYRIVDLVKKNTAEIKKFKA